MSRMSWDDRTSAYTILSFYRYFDSTVMYSVTRIIHHYWCSHMVADVCNFPGKYQITWWYILISMVREKQLVIINCQEKTLLIFVDFTVDTASIDCLIPLGNALTTWLGYTTWIIPTLKYYHSSRYTWRHVISHLTNAASPCRSYLHVSLPVAPFTNMV